MRAARLTEQSQEPWGPFDGERLVRYLGPADLGVVTRTMGLILAVIGIQMLIGGIGGAVDAYRGLTPGYETRGRCPPCGNHCGCSGSRHGPA